MSCLQTVSKADPLFDYSRWTALLPGLTEQYEANQPVPHILLTDFLTTDVASEIAQEFPNPDADTWTQYKHRNENKMGMAKRDLFPAGLREVAYELNSPPFLAWLSELTGISELIADPSLEGGGLHQSGCGGFLNVHTDFSHHHYHKQWRRRVNLILYLNPVWRPEWGGAIELWDVKMRNCVAKYPPLLNHALIFNTDERSLHGFPEPLRCPEGESRKSLALYYYTVERNTKIPSSSTNYRARPGDGMTKSALIWLDKLAVDLYSRAKTRFGFSDELASKVLGFISGKK
ncbi:MAG TPA: 2OG-Fe(II) oxygenase [Terriglobales bacterium]|nr:2OG-Fe(II) oxygenase [Terriglobales bacterium]